VAGSGSGTRFEGCVPISIKVKIRVKMGVLEVFEVMMEVEEGIVNILRGGVGVDMLPHLLEIFSFKMM
jgi:hypothetical protein